MTGYPLEHAPEQAFMDPETLHRRTYSTMTQRKKGAANEANRTGKLSNKRPETKMGRLEAMLRRSEGATIPRVH